MMDTLRKLNYLLSRREKGGAVLLFMMILLGSILEVAGVGAIPAFVMLLSTPERLLEYEAVQSTFDFLGIETPGQMVVGGAIALVALFTLKNVYLAFLAYAQARYASGRQAALSNRLFRAYMRTAYTFHLQRNTAELLRNIRGETGSVASGVLMSVLAIAREVLMLAMIVILLMVMEPIASLVSAVVLGSIVFGFLRVTKKSVGEYARKERWYNKIGIKAVQQGLGGLKDTKILGRENFFLDTFGDSAWFKARATRFKAVLQELPRLFLETTAVIGLLLAAALMYRQGRPSETIIPMLTLLSVAAVRMMPSFTTLAGAFTRLKWGVVSLDVVYDDLHALEEEERLLQVQQKSAAHASLQLEREIRLENIHYRYPGAADKALSGVSLEIPHGSAVAFVGPSGAGKTTIVDIILGLIVPAEGRVLIDGNDIQYAPEQWQRQIGYIPQHIYLTDDSIRGNIAFGISEKDIDDKAVWRALEMAQLRGFVESLPEGIRTVVGERGVRLSGGQRQRIGIARALYHNPTVLIMDEATSALDNQTERYIVEALERLRGELTMIVIAHRLTTVKDCDTLYFLKEGRLSASGTYDSLLAKSDDFAAMAA